MTNPTIKDKLSEIFVKWDLPTRQAALNEIMQLIESAITEAYKKGYTDKGIEELMKHENNKGNQI